MRKPLVWLGGEIKTPPFSYEARLKTGYLLRALQLGGSIRFPRSRPLPGIGRNCHELRILDKNVTWRIIYRTDSDAILILEVFNKKTQKTPDSVIAVCKQRINRYDRDAD